MNSGWSSGDIREAGLRGRPRGFLRDDEEASDSCDRVVTVLWCRRVSSGEESFRVIIVSGLNPSSGFGDSSCGSPPPNRPMNILIFQVPGGNINIL
jgi:hypothetical protein